MNQNKWPSMSEIGAVVLVFGVMSIAMTPALVKALQQRSDDQKACLQNTKMLGLAVLEYAQDNDESFPPGYKGSPQSWAGRLYPYVRSVDAFHCPNDPTVSDSSLTPAAVPVSYAINSNLLAGAHVAGSNDSVNLADLKSPAKTIVFFEVAGDRTQITLGDEGSRGYWHRPASQMFSSSGDGLGNGPEWGWRGSGASPIRYALDRHNGTANYVIADGHAVWKERENVSVGRSNASVTGEPDPDKGIAAGSGNDRYGLTFSVEAPLSNVEIIRPGED